LCFSLFTLLAAFSTSIWTLAIFRFLAGVGIGGEWSIGAALVSEDWPEERRTMGAALMHTGYYFGFFLAAFANFFVGSRFGWRYMFVVGGLPALLIAVIRNNVREPERWETKTDERGHGWALHRSFFALFTPQYRRRTILNTLYLIVSLAGLWAGSVYTPAAMTLIAERVGRSSADAARLATYSTGLLGIATVLGALIVPGLADWLGRRVTLGIFYVIMMLAVWFGFGHVFYMQQGVVGWFLVCAVLMGIGGASRSWLALACATIRRSEHPSP
jgi:MFS family permease